MAMMVPAGPDLGRRARRRQESLDEILDTALEVMAESGVAGLSLGEVARRMGIRPPSLYQYLHSKNDVYDALFRRGWEELNDRFTELDLDLTPDSDVRAVLGMTSEAFVRWMVEHPVLAQLMIWRPVPGFVPSAAAYAPAQACLAWGHDVLEALVGHGLLVPDAASGEAMRLHNAQLAGVVSQHLANEPDSTYEDGLNTTLVPALDDLFLSRYRPTRTDPRRAT